MRRIPFEISRWLAIEEGYSSPTTYPWHGIAAAMTSFVAMSSAKAASVVRRNQRVGRDDVLPITSFILSRVFFPPLIDSRDSWPAPIVRDPSE